MNQCYPVLLQCYLDIVLFCPTLSSHSAPPYPFYYPIILLCPTLLPYPTALPYRTLSQGRDLGPVVARMIPTRDDIVNRSDYM